MSNIKILDCTLRDGGYINNWEFGERTIKKIISKLSNSNIDIIECGFIRDVVFDKENSIFNDVEKIRDYISPKNKNITYVAMIDHPYIPIDKISKFDGSSIDGIRLTFHKDEKEIDEALTFGKQLMDKGYKVFIQPVGATSYTDEDLLKLIEKVNKFKPYSFYLVDTLGIMYKNDLLRLFHLLDNNLNDSISIGFHSHNNLQLSFSNAQELLMLHTKRNIIIDSSVFGMGRGAGNLCTELVTHYINENIEEKYNTVPLLEIVDEHLSKISSEIRWGYSVPYYIAAITNCHPNYASYLMNKQTISVKSIHTILKQLIVEKRDVFDEQYIEDLYINYQDHFIDDTEEIKKIKDIIKDRKILIIAPGRSIDDQWDKINDFIRDNNPFVFSVNFIPEAFKTNAVFVSNLKRFEDLSDVINKRPDKVPLITTSNINNSQDETSLVVNYSDLLINNPIISDNSGLMLINLLKRLSVNSISLAGFDGFNLNKKVNYFSEEMINNVEKDELIKKTMAISKQLELVRKSLDIHYITRTAYNI